MRVIGLINGGEGVTRCYLHANSEGNSCVNGVALPLFLGGPDENARLDPQSLSIVLAPFKQPVNDNLIAVNDGECVLQRREGESRLSVVVPGFIGVSARCEFWRLLRCGILTVSDKGSRGERKDTAGPALAGLLIARGGMVEEAAIVPDDRDTIAEKLREWVDEKKLNLILTTGGTGLSKRDVTPEALRQIAEREIPGMGEIMRLRGMSSTPRAFLTRGLGVTRGDSLIVALPGSERGAMENFAAILPGLRHAIDILNGWESECGGHHKQRTAEVHG